jgi:hypothetical protein
MRLASRAAGTADLSTSLRSGRDDTAAKFAPSSWLPRIEAACGRHAPCCIQRLLQPVFFTPISSLASGGNGYATILQAVLNRNGEKVKSCSSGETTVPPRESQISKRDVGRRSVENYCSRMV